MPFLLAAGAAPAFFAEVAAILVVTALLAYLGNRIGVMPIVSFLIAGVLIGPQALGLVQDEALIEAVAEIGVVLLLFTIGIEFSLEKLARIQRLIFLGGGMQVVFTIALVAGVLALLGVDWRTGVFTGCLVALSSTVIVMKLLMNRRETNSDHGQASLGILIFQDLAIVAMVLLVPILAGEGGSAGSIMMALGTAVVIVVLVLVIARRIMPKVLEAVARTCSQEIFLLAVVAICLGTAFLTSLAGVSLSLGAFLAGLVVSESRYSEMAFGEILPLQILFSAAFFVSVGLLLDPRFLIESPLLVLGMIGGVLVVKFIATSVSLKILGYSAGLTTATGLLLAQVGEFSFVLERAGRDVGLYAAGMAETGPPAFIAVTVILMLATPLMARLAPHAGDRRTAAVPSDALSDASHASSSASRRGHVVIAGYGESAKTIARALRQANVPFVIVTLSPDGAQQAEALGFDVIRGNYLRTHELGLAGLRVARLLVIADDDAHTAHRAIEAARAMNPDLPVLARAGLVGTAEALATTGVEVVTDEWEGIARMVRRALEISGGDGRLADQYESEIRSVSQAVATEGERPSTAWPSGGIVRLSERQLISTACGHVEQTRPVKPSSEGCEACIAMGDTWVHLRICMTCGHVGCCNSSKNKHAQRHALEHDHPIIRSLEPGERWAWCYVDERYL